MEVRKLFSKKILIPVGILVVGLLVAGGVLLSNNIASANTATSNKTLMQRLAEKLGIGEDKVTTAMDQIREENQEQRKAEISTKLDKAVSDGVITAEQKTKIQERMTALEQKREQERKEQQAWEEETGIDMTKLRDYGIGGFGFGGGHGKGPGFGSPAE